MTWLTDMTDDSLDRAITACESRGPTNAEDWQWQEMLCDERQRRKDEGTWWTSEDAQERSGASAS